MRTPTNFIYFSFSTLGGSLGDGIATPACVIVFTLIALTGLVSGLVSGLGISPLQANLHGFAGGSATLLADSRSSLGSSADAGLNVP